MVKIDIISGFLGAGKTTLIKKLLKDGFQGEQVVLIENEFGEIGIDGGFLKEAGIQIREMNSGCICCSLVGDFGTSLKEVVTKYDPDRILIEPSGVGKLSDVIKAVQGVQDEVDIKLNSYTTVVDAKKCKMYMKNFGEFFDNQIQYAGAIIMSRTDIASEKKVQESLELLRSLNKDAAIITTPIENLDGKKLVEVMEHPVSLEQEMLEEEHEHHHHHDGECGCGHDHEEHEHHHHHDGECGCGHDHHHHHADEVFTSWGRETAKKYTKEEIEAALKILSEAEDLGVILRAKGMVDGKDGQWIYFDMVPEEYEVRTGTPQITGKICVIGSKMAEDKIAEIFGVNE
jgi:G3E family GTPase